MIKPHAKTKKDPRFNGIANTTHCHPRKSPYPKPFKHKSMICVYLF